MKRALLLCLSGVLLGCLPHPLSGQVRVTSCVELGSETPVSRFRYGASAEVSAGVSPLVELHGGLRLNNHYPSGLGDVKLGATVRFNRNSDRWSCVNEIDYANFAPYPMSQLWYRLLFAWQTEHVRIDLGNAFAFFVGSGVVKYNLFRPSFSVRGILRDKDSPWNAALYIRNFNRFESHGSRAMEWGGEVSATVCGGWRLFCEPYVTTVGNFNGTAEFYNFNCNLGVSYTW